jgi:outer membrane murein-binding lipoprotein Lpp
MGSKKHKSGAGKVVLWVVLVVVLLAAVGGGVYYWQHQKVTSLQKQVNTLNAQVNAMQSKLSSAEAAAATAAASKTNVSTDDLVIEAAQAACLTVDDPATAKPYGFTLGTIGTAKKKVVYSADKNYASLNATCGPAGNQGANQTFYIEKAGNNTWVTTYYGTAAPDAATVKKFTIPAANTFN